MQNCFSFMGESGLRGTIRPIRLQLKDNYQWGVIILPTQTMHCCKGTPSKMCNYCLMLPKWVPVNNDAKLLELIITSKASRHAMGRLFSPKRRERNWWRLVTCQSLPSQKMKFWRAPALLSLCIQAQLSPSPTNLKTSKEPKQAQCNFPFFAWAVRQQNPLELNMGFLTCSPWSVTCLDGVYLMTNHNLRCIFLWPKLDFFFRICCGSQDIYPNVWIFFRKLRRPKSQTKPPKKVKSWAFFGIL